MDKGIVTIQEVRKLFVQLMDGLTIQELNIIPEGFNNNIIWNFGHVIVSQQILCYKLSGLPIKIEQSYALKYAKGTKPETFLDKKELEFLTEKSVTLIDDLIADLDKKIFSTYPPYPSTFNVPLTNVDEAIKYLTMHEGYHYGYVMALKRLIQK